MSARGWAPGYVPHRVAWKDFILSHSGALNPYKRLQWRTIFDVLDIQPTERALDFGCSSGYMTYEMARLAGHATGIDVVDVEQNLIPSHLYGRLTFVRSEGQRLPFADESFDVILMSEVIGMIPDDREFVREARRLLAPGGRIVLVTGFGRLAIKDEYQKRGWLLRLLRALGRAPESYEDYTAKLMASFGAFARTVPPPEYYESIAAEFGLEIAQIRYTPSALAQRTFERIQFVALCLGLPTVGSGYFAFYPLLLLLDRIGRSRPGTGAVMKLIKK